MFEENVRVKDVWMASMLAVLHDRFEECGTCVCVNRYSQLVRFGRQQRWHSPQASLSGIVFLCSWCTLLFLQLFKLFCMSKVRASGSSSSLAVSFANFRVLGRFGVENTRLIVDSCHVSGLFGLLQIPTASS